MQTFNLRSMLVGPEDQKTNLNWKKPNKPTSTSFHNKILFKSSFFTIVYLNDESALIKKYSSFFVAFASSKLIAGKK
jgi:hypothetical protein